ncbi:MAG: hypothetical protein JNK15_08305 [Planctomycetes bacterium]|nr:hypothetical protein [Planctomycetota bacterium]
MRTFVLWPFLLALAACWQPRYFTPREHVGGTGPAGQPAAIYPLPGEGATAAQPAEVRVWSAGAKARYADDDREVVELQIGLELENNGPNLLVLDPQDLVCEELMIDGVLQPKQTPVRVDGMGIAEPGATARVDAVFELPTTRPRTVDSFAVKFVVRIADRVVLQQTTPFVPFVRQADPDRAYWVPMWGFGFGMHSHFGWH